MIYLACYLATGLCAVIAVLIYPSIAKKSSQVSLWDVVRRENATLRERIIDDVIPAVGGSVVLIVGWPLVLLNMVQKVQKKRPMLKNSPIEAFVAGLDNLFALRIHASMVQNASETVGNFVERHGRPHVTNSFNGLTIHMWAWEGQKFDRRSDLAFGNLYLADVGNHRLTFQRNVPEQ